MKDQLVTIAQSLNPNDLLVLKSKLDGHGIWCYLADQHTATMIGYASVAIGGAKLTIRASDAKKALEILNELDLEADSDNNLANPASQRFKPDDEFVAFLKNPKSKDIWVNLARFSNNEDLATAIKILTELGIDSHPKTFSKGNDDEAAVFSLSVKFGDITKSVEALSVSMADDLDFEPAANEYFEMLFQHHVHELPDDPDEKVHKLTQKKLDDRNARLAAFGIIFFLTALAFFILYAFVEEFIMDLFW